MSELKPDGKTVIQDEWNGQQVNVRICPHGVTYLDCAECIDWSKVKYGDSLWQRIKFHIRGWFL